MGKLNLKDKVDGKELDLSLMSLSAAPVEELAMLPKVTCLDLSCNLFITLPDDFCKLKHIVKLDLSKNDLTALPRQFGDLVKLEHLDLYQNQLKMLPVSFSQLLQLKWMDLKNNPLEPELAKSAGDCLDAKQCKTCAVNIVKFMQRVARESERRLQEKRQRERELEAQRKAEEVALLEKLNQKKKEMKDRRKKEEEARLRKEREHQASVREKKRQALREEQPVEVAQITPSSSWCPGFCSSVCLFSISVFILTMYILCMALVWCNMYGDGNKVCEHLRNYLSPLWPTLQNFATSAIDFMDYYVPVRSTAQEVRQNGG